MVSVAQLHRAHPLADAADDGASSSPRFGRYRLLGRLAMGGMAEVWAGELRGRSGLRTPVVIKRVRAELACDPRFVQQFVTEARVATRLSHANICEVFELGDVDGELYLAMEYLRGASVRQVLRHGALAPGLAAAVVAGAAAGLDYAHRLTDERWARREKQLEAGKAALLGVGGELQGLAQHDLPQLELQPDQP